MAKVKTYNLAPQSNECVQLEWEGTAVHVRFAGERVATLRDGRSRKLGWSTRLANGKTLTVCTLRPVLLPELAILVDNKHVDDSPSHPRKVLKASAHGLLIGAGIFTALTLTGKRAIGRFDLVYEIAQALGAILMLREMYTGIAVVAIVLITDFVMLDLAFIRAPGRYLIWPAVSRVLFAMFLLRSFVALHDLRTRYRSDDTSRS